MTDKELKEIREKISCPQLGDEYYGEWGILTLNQRRTIKRLLDFIEAQEEYINRLQAENERLEHQLETLCITLKLTKAEAYKEFAERLKKAKIYSLERHENILPVAVIDWILKEMVGE